LSVCWDCVVIGVGGMGSAACAELARRGVRVLGLEQHAAAHDRGSSHGESRIIRQCYFEHPDYVPLLLRAYDQWRRLESESGRALYYETGLLISGTSDGEAIRGARLAADQHRLSLDDLTPAEVARRFPIFRPLADHVQVFERNAGYLLVEECVRAHWEIARKNGATLLEDEPVLDWTPAGSQVVVRTSRREIRTDKLVITAGAWTTQLLQSLKLPLRVVRKVSGWFPMTTAGVARSAGMPTWYFELPGAAFYGFPPLDDRTIKAAEHTGGQPVGDPSTLDREVRPTDLTSLETFVSAVLPDASSQPEKTSVCMYTLSPDHHFLIDRHPEHPQVVFAAGFSGHGFKFCPVIGEALADLATSGRTDLPIDFLSLRRLSLP
jgi:sarcosine oxidase